MNYTNSPKIVLFCIFLTSLMSCRNEQYNLVQLKKSTNNEISITGFTDDPNGFKIFSLVPIKFAPKYNSIDSIWKFDQDSIRVILKSIKKPKFLGLSIDGFPRINTTIFTSPRDNITFKINKGEIEFKGNNAGNYRFYFEMDQSIVSRPTFTKDVLNYKNNCKLLYDQKKQFLKKYIISNKVSDDFKKLANARLDFEYLYSLISPKKENGILVFSQNPVQNISIQGGEHFNLEEYFNHISLEYFNRPDLLGVDYYYKSFLAYLRNYFIRSSFKPYSKERFDEEKKFIVNSLEGEVKQYALFRLTTDYFRENPIENITNLKTLIDSNKTNVTNPIWLKKISSIEADIKLMGDHLVDDALNSAVVNLKGDTLKFKDVLANAGNSIKAIDFWASWCGPCISEIKIGNSNRKTFSKEKGVKWIYISIDDDEQAWVRKVKELSKFGLTHESYLLLNQKETELRTFLEVNSIPRYVLFDPTDKLIHKNAPRPSDSIAFQNVLDQSE